MNKRSKRYTDEFKMLILELLEEGRTKKSPFRRIIELFKLNNTNRKVILWLIKRTAYLTQNGCANII